MWKDEFYHGTRKKSANSILISNCFYPTTGDRHWLGDGIYFYEEDFYAYNWLVYDFKKNFDKEVLDKDKIIHNYSILSVNLDINPERIFNFEKAEHKILFDITMEEVIKKSEYSKRFKKNKFPEGVILNIMFKEMGYNKSYDLIVAIFTRRKSNYGNAVLRLNYIPEKQLSKSQQKIKEIIYISFIYNIIKGWKNFFQPFYIIKYDIYYFFSVAAAIFAEGLYDLLRPAITSFVIS